jgi:hypothetical protein
LIHTQASIKHFGPTNIGLWKDLSEMTVKNESTAIAQGLDERTTPLLIVALQLG